jgi:hypothetical protein
MSRDKKENRRTQRVRLQGPLKVVMGSMGGAVRYDLMTQDISPNGFFLAFDKPGRFPFTPASIMEVWLELEPQNTIFFNGKMARVVYPTDPTAQESGPGIAIRIIQIDRENEGRLNEFIERKIADRTNRTGPATANDSKVAG